jgi:hypothetical protein
VGTNLSAPTSFCIFSFCFWGEVEVEVEVEFLIISTETPCWEIERKKTNF